MRDLAEGMGVLEPCWTPWADTAIIAFLGAGLLGDAQALVEHLERVTKGSVAAGRGQWLSQGGPGWRSPKATLRKRRSTTTAPWSCWKASTFPSGEHVRCFLTGGSSGVPAAPVPARAPLARPPRKRGLWGHEACFQARAELEAAGGRRRRVNSAELDAQERNVARMAAQGSTNGEIALSLFISVKTVEHHLTSAYLKLGVHSRKDLRARWKSAELPQRS